jgi:hypothetical protein
MLKEVSSLETPREPREFLDVSIIGTVYDRRASILEQCAPTEEGNISFALQGAGNGRESGAL